MVKEAEENAEADKELREGVEAKNQFESYLYSARSTATGENLKDKISPEDRKQIEDTITSALSWLEEHQSESKAIYEEKRKEVEAVVAPVIAKAYQGSPPPGEGGSPGGNADGNTSSDDDGPTVEEVN